MLLERPPANLRCSLPTSEALPIWGQAAGFYFSPILLLWRPKAMRALGRLLASSPFPPGAARMEAQKPLGGFVDLALESTSTSGACVSTAHPALGGLSQARAGLGQCCGTRAAADVKEEEKMAHADKLPGNFCGASYSSLSRQLQLCSGLLSLCIAAPLWPPSYSVLLSLVQTHS